VFADSSAHFKLRHEQKRAVFSFTQPHAGSLRTRPPGRDVGGDPLSPGRVWVINANDDSQGFPTSNSVCYFYSPLVREHLLPIDRPVC
jgi:hypothetical protein